VHQFVAGRVEVRVSISGDYQDVPRWRGSFPATPEAGPILRNELAAIARACGLGDQRVSDVKLAVTEAVTNVVRHAYTRKEPGQVIATADVDGHSLRIVIADTGRGMVSRSDNSGLGLGLPLIARLADNIDVVSKASGTEIHMAFACPASPGR
jgi:anti-sigma regulatory factor (Ser/Thr protein kinase)